MVSREVLQESLNQLLTEIGTEFENKAFELTFLTNRIIEICGVEEMTLENRTTKNLLIDKFGEKVIFSQPSDRSKSPMVMMSSVPLEEMAERIRQFDNFEKSVQETAVKLRKEMLHYKLQYEGYVEDETIIERSFNNFVLPPMWELFMKHLFSNKKSLKDNKLRRAKSVYMDLYFSLTGANTPKHVALAQSVHHLTRSKHIVSMLFRLGHCVSYTALRELDEELWRKVIWESQSEYVPIPANIVRNPSLFLHGAIDNNDFMEETLSGKNTTHVTAMVLYQESSTVDHHRAIATKEMIRNLDIEQPSPLSCQTLKQFDHSKALPISSSYVDMPPLQTSTGISKSELLRVAMKTSIVNENTLELIENSGVPGWSPFHQLLTNSSLPLTAVGFCPIIPHAPTSRDVVYSAMINFMSLCQSCRKEKGVLTADMSIYLIAKYIQMQSDEFSDLILRVGTFHLQKIWLNCLGQYLEGSGIECIMTEEAGLYGEKTFKSILSGHHYNRGVRAHKLLYEALIYLQLDQYVKCAEPQVLEKLFVSSKLQILREAIADYNVTDFCNTYTLLESDLENAHFFKSFNDFMAQRSADNDTIQYYMKYCQMVEILLDSLKADRECNFELHIASVRRMLPYFFSMNHHNYARGITMYLQDMIQLPDGVKFDLEKGMLSVKKSAGTFNSVACDLALEQSQIRSSAVTGGLIGITQKKDAMGKWILLYPAKNAIHNVFLAFCDMNNDPTGAVEDSFTHNEWSPSRIKRDEADLKSLIRSLSEKDIFTEKDEILSLHNIYNGKVVEESVSSCLLKLEEHGENLQKEFFDKCFIEKERSVFDHMKRSSFRNFNYVPKQKSTNCQKALNKELLKSKESHDVQKTVILSIQRECDLKSVASYELGEYPRALADVDGFMKKPQKHILMNVIENEVNCACDLNCVLSSDHCTIHIFDGMALVFNIQLHKYTTFGDFAEAYYKYITSFYSRSNVQRIDVVFDRYDDISMKTMEAKRRAKGSSPVQLKILGPTTHIPNNIKNFISCTSNKQELVRFLCKSANRYVKVNENQELVICGGFDDATKCFKIQGSETSEIFELRSNHIEADTRIYVHAFHAVQPGSQVMIHSSDTDVFVLAVHFWPKLKKYNCSGLWMKVISKKSRTIGCHLLSDYLGEAITNVLPVLHAFTGCDTTSKISSKKSAFNEIKKPYAQDVLKPLGNGLSLTQSQLTALELLYLKLINKPGLTADEARYISISRTVGIGNLALDRIPCTSDALHQHALRASAQTYIWKNALNPLYEPLDLMKFGYEKHRNELLPKFLTKEAVPDNLLPPCNCKSHCMTFSCSCKKHKTNCIPLCVCIAEDCKNVLTV